MGGDQCGIEYTLPRKCQKCRLERCLTEGMKKEFLMTEEQKQKRQKRLEDIRKITSQRSSTTQSSILSNIESPVPTVDYIDRVSVFIELFRSIEWIFSSIDFNGY